jgi:hypothetical protein
LYRGAKSEEKKVKVNTKIDLQTSQIHFTNKSEKSTKQKNKILPKDKNRIEGKIKHNSPNKSMKVLKRY